MPPPHSPRGGEERGERGHRGCFLLVDWFIGLKTLKTPSKTTENYKKQKTPSVLLVYWLLLCTALYPIILYNTVQYYTIPYYTVLYYTVSNCTILYYTLLYFTSMQH